MRIMSLNRCPEPVSRVTVVWPTGLMDCDRLPIASKSAPFLNNTHRSMLYSPISKSSHVIPLQQWLLYYYFFFTIFVRITYHRAPVIHTEEYAPQTTPIIRGAANSRIELTPMIKRIVTITNVVREV